MKTQKPTRVQRLDPDEFPSFYCQLGEKNHQTKADFSIVRSGEGRSRVSRDWEGALLVRACSDHVAQALKMALPLKPVLSKEDIT